MKTCPVTSRQRSLCGVLLWAQGVEASVGRCRLRRHHQELNWRALFSADLQQLVGWVKGGWRGSWQRVGK